MDFRAKRFHHWDLMRQATKQDQQQRGPRDRHNVVCATAVLKQCGCDLWGEDHTVLHFRMVAVLRQQQQHRRTVFLVRRATPSSALTSVVTASSWLRQQQIRQYPQELGSYPTRVSMVVIPLFNLWFASTSIFENLTRFDYAVVMDIQMYSRWLVESGI
mmetsp:Transcript_985/g.2024  ORF Transcript_985/g.2024 Transcript_985/m.2024 type:complete len:159 (-) Transcript_985:1858-2334(-)